jgi:hypothetical protein
MPMYSLIIKDPESLRILNPEGSLIPKEKIMSGLTTEGDLESRAINGD